MRSGPEPTACGSAECFAQLKSRPVDDLRAKLIGATHSFWYVQDRTGAQSVVSGGPETVAGVQYLRIWVSGEPRNGVDNVAAPTSWNSGLSCENCAGVDRLLGAAREFPLNQVGYDWSGPNSNSAARHVGDAGGFRPPRPSGGVGWDAPAVP